MACMDILNGIYIFDARVYIYGLKLTVDAFICTFLLTPYYSITISYTVYYILRSVESNLLFANASLFMLFIFITLDLFDVCFISIYL